MLALPIFPGRRQPSIVGAGELNFCVRYGNRWTLTAISTNLFNFISSRVSLSSMVYYTTLSSSCQLVTRTGFEPMLTA